MRSPPPSLPAMTHLFPQPETPHSTRAGLGVVPAGVLAALIATAHPRAARGDNAGLCRPAALSTHMTFSARYCSANQSISQPAYGKVQLNGFMLKMVRIEGNVCISGRARRSRELMCWRPGGAVKTSRPARGLGEVSKHPSPAVMFVGICSLAQNSV